METNKQQLLSTNQEMVVQILLNIIDNWKQEPILMETILYMVKKYHCSPFTWRSLDTWGISVLLKGPTAAHWLSRVQIHNLPVIKTEL